MALTNTRTRNLSAWRGGSGILRGQEEIMAYSQISIRLGGLVVELGSEATYPDMVSDLTGRCLNTFKEALDKWLEEEDNKEERKSWSEVGIHVVNAKINNRPS